VPLFLFISKGDLPKNVLDHYDNIAASRQFYVFSIELENNVTYIRAHNPDMKKADAILWKWN
jgi:hypothetical protein